MKTHEKSNENRDTISSTEGSDQKPIDTGPKRSSNRAKVPSLNRSRATGPRTARGKNKSKYNAVKHGIFVSAVLPHESREYKRLLRLLLEDYPPHRNIDAMLVEQLAQVFLKMKRLTDAEVPELILATIAQEEERTEKAEIEASAFLQSSEAMRRGALHRSDNPNVLAVCIRYLDELREKISQRGFDPEQDLRILNWIYGSRAVFCEKIVQIYYAVTNRHEPSNNPADDPVRQASPQDLAKAFAAALEKEIHRLRERRGGQIDQADMRYKNQLLRPLPLTDTAECLLRYRTYLERRFDRILAQLESLRNARK